jgi:3-hydroxyisobutyrate dehydrogenase-like beta-hydroxyacid dehydrogenase
VTTGLIGLGKMGTAIAERILGAGHPLVVYNRTAAKTRRVVEGGATVIDRPERILTVADVCFTSLTGDEALEEVAAQVLSGARAGTVLTDISTDTLRR